MIKTRASKETTAVFNGERGGAGSAANLQAAWRKLVQVHNAKVLDDLRVPPGNRLEAVTGKAGTASASTTSGASASNGATGMPTRSK